jgi:hypothetical protein
LTSLNNRADRAFRDTLRSIIAEVPTEFAHYGANEAGWTPARKWTPRGTLPESLECSGISIPSPLVRCTMFRSPGLVPAERRLSEVVGRVQGALRGLGWTIHESLDSVLTDYDDRWSQRSVVFKNTSAVTVEAQLWKSKKDGHHEVDIVIEGVGRISQELHRMISEAEKGFVNYGAGGGNVSGSSFGVLSSYDSNVLNWKPVALTRQENWTPAGNLPDALECVGKSNAAPLVRCTMFRSSDIVLAERRLVETIVQVQGALPGSDWTKDESAGQTLMDYDADWSLRKVVFKRSSGTAVEAQLWRRKKDGHYEVDVVVTSLVLAGPPSLGTFTGLSQSQSDLGVFPGFQVSNNGPVTYPGSVLVPTAGITPLDVSSGAKSPRSVTA